MVVAVRVSHACQLSAVLSLLDYSYSSQATSEQLARLVKIMLRLGQNAPFTPSTLTMTPAMMLATTLHRADFWELRRFRGIFVARIVVDQLMTYH